MKLLQTLVASDGFRISIENPRRTAHYQLLMKRAEELRVDAILLPGGYWTVRNEVEVRATAMEMAEMARSRGISLIAGIDVEEEEPGRAKKSKVGPHPAFPYFGFAAALGQALKLWQQTSDNGSNSHDVPEEMIPSNQRVVSIAEKNVATLICGELYSPHARRAMGESNVDLVVDLGHVGMGQGLIPAMKCMVKAALCTVAHTQHVKSGSLHYLDAKGIQNSVSCDECEYVGDEDFWIAYTVRTIE